MSSSLWCEFRFRLELCYDVVCQAAGVIPVSHASGGPLYDIIVPFNGEPTGMFIPDEAEKYRII
jgi:hypothetical protein